MSVKIICYSSFGYPTIEKSIERALAYVKGGCDALEVDFPTDNPFLDSEFIGNRMKAAYATNNNYDDYFDGIKKMREEFPKIKMLALVYEHTIISIGVQKFVKRLLECDIADLILVGPKDEEIKKELIAKGMKVSCFVNFSPKEGDIELAKNSNGFVYLQSKSTGEVTKGLETLEKCIQNLRDEGIASPIYCGMGVSTPEDIETIRLAKGDGAFIGSALLKLESDDEKIEYLKKLKAKA